MKTNRPLLLLLLVSSAACSAKYTSGKTACSDKGECPSGYTCRSAGSSSVCVSKSSDCSASKPCPSGSTCWDDGTASAHYCVDNSVTQCPSTSTYYCSQSDTCWASAGACSTVVWCGNAKYPTYVICTTVGYVPDCNGDSCLAPDAGVPLPGNDASVGGPDAGRDTASTKDGPVADAARDGARDLATSGDGPLSCTAAATCSAGQQCFSNQCCTPPAAGGVCSAYPACGCPAGQICYPSSTTHGMACFTSNNLTEGADCTNGNCQAGFGCFGNICKRYCLKDADCPAIGNVQKCLQTSWSSDGTDAGGTDIPGLMVCQRVCDPAHPQSPASPLLSCPTGFGCVSSTTGASGCYKTAPLPAGSKCTTDADCQPGNYCSTSGACYKYCLTNDDCTAGTTCQFTWSPPEYAGNKPVGYCN